jgi:hypothetical protein
MPTIPVAGAEGPTIPVAGVEGPTIPVAGVEGAASAAAGVDGPAHTAIAAKAKASADEMQAFHRRDSVATASSSVTVPKD